MRVIEYSRKYNKVARLAKELKEAINELASLENERFGFEHSQTDNDRIIDTLDYGTDDLEYSEYLKLMSKYRSESQEDSHFKLRQY